MTMHLWIKYFSAEVLRDLCCSEASYLTPRWVIRKHIKAKNLLPSETTSF